MKRLATLAFLGVLALGAAKPPDACGQTLLVDYVGFDYEDPNPSPSQFGEMGSGYVSLGMAPGVFAPLVSDTANFEYTYVLGGLSVVNITPIGSYLVIDYSPGTFTVYEDSKSTGTPATFGANPPTVLAPGTFSDGTAILIGAMSGFQIIYNTVNRNGSFEGTLAFTGGSQLSNFPPDRRDGWTFSGLSGNSTEVPPGYEHQVDGQVFLSKPTPNRESSWGGIKSRYR